MIYAYSVEQIRTVEKAALARDGDATLMRRASAAVALAVAERTSPPRPGRRVVLLVGSGNNGGDALFAGAMLRGRGMAVTAVLLDPDKAHPAGLAALRRAGGRVGRQTTRASGPRSTAPRSSSTGWWAWRRRRRCANRARRWSSGRTPGTRCGWRSTCPAGSSPTPAWSERAGVPR